MSSFNQNQGSSFLPEDYLQRRVERRTTIIAIALFAVVMFGVIAAFFVTNRQWNSVKAVQEEINQQYTAEAKRIEQLKVLQAQKAEMLEKAEITTALIESIPRSVLMAEIINRMPEDLTLTDFALEGERIREDRRASSRDSKNKSRSLSRRGSSSSRGKKDEPAKPAVPPPPKFEFTLEIQGISNSDEEVADFHAALANCPLLSRVDLVYSGSVIVDDVAVREFTIEAQLSKTADARHIEPLRVSRSAFGERPGGNVPGAPSIQEMAERLRGMLPGSGPEPGESNAGVDTEPKE